MFRAALLRSLLVLSICLGGLPMAAGAAGLPAKDEQVVRGVQLDQPLLDKLIAIQRDANALRGDDGEDADDEGPATDPSVLASLDAMVRHASRDPRVAPVLARHGLTARQYIAAQIALMRAALAARVGATAADAGQHGTSAANIAFARSRMAQIQAVFDED